MIILEGPDCAGKTTLADHLKRTVPGIRPRPKFVASDMSGRGRDQPTTPPPTGLADAGNLAKRADEQMSLMERVVLELARYSHPANLYDRHPLISEYIYSSVLNRRLPPMFAHPTARAFRRELLEKSVVVLCLPQFDAYEANVLESDNQPWQVKDNHQGLYTAYQAWLSHTPTPGRTYVYDYTQNGALEFVTDLVRHHLEGIG